MKKIDLGLFLLLTATLMGPATPPTHASGSQAKLVEKGDMAIALLTKIYTRYPVHIYKKEELEHLAIAWESAKSALHTPHTRPASGGGSGHVVMPEAAPETIQETYSQINLLLRDACIDVANYADKLILQFDAQQEARFFDPYRSDWKNSRQVALQEFARAKKAFLDGQFYYSAHLYDRSILLLDSSYEKAGAMRGGLWISIRR